MCKEVEITIVLTQLFSPKVSITYGCCIINACSVHYTHVYIYPRLVLIALFNYYSYYCCQFSNQLTNLHFKSDINSAGKLIDREEK